MIGGEILQRRFSSEVVDSYRQGKSDRNDDQTGQPVETTRSGDEIPITIQKNTTDKARLIRAL